MSSDVEAEWARAQASGRKKRRPLVFGVITGVVVTLLALGGWMLVLEANLQNAYDRIDRGETVYERRGPMTPFAMIAIPLFVGIAVGFGVFKAMGGKVDEAYRRGLDS